MCLIRIDQSASEILACLEGPNVDERENTKTGEKPGKSGVK
jgi:hypothetical protein